MQKKQLIVCLKDLIHGVKCSYARQEWGFNLVDGIVVQHGRYPWGLPFNLIRLHIVEARKRRNAALGDLRRILINQWRYAQQQSIFNFIMQARELLGVFPIDADV